MVLTPAKAGTRTAATAPLNATLIAHGGKFIGCDIHYFYVPPGSSIFLRWFVYEDAATYEANDPMNSTTGKTQAVKDYGVINAYLESLDESFEPAIYVCDFVLKKGQVEISPHERAAIWLMKK